jgi:hypothetical protein
MPKLKTPPAKNKKKVTKYSKLMLVASKELNTKKKALVAAERALQTAKQRHEDLIAEVARLDMVERSLKALVEGTEPPTNVRYVYNYPQWVWQYQTPYSPGYTTSPGYTITCQNSQITGASSNFQNGGNLVCNTTTSSLPPIASGAVVGNVSWVNNTLVSENDTLTVDLSTHAEVVEPEYMEAVATATNGS